VRRCKLFFDAQVTVKEKKEKKKKNTGNCAANRTNH